MFNSFVIWIKTYPELCFSAALRDNIKNMQNSEVKATLALFTVSQWHSDFRSFFLDPSSLEDEDPISRRNLEHDSPGDTAAYLRITQSSKLGLFAYLCLFNWKCRRSLCPVWYRRLITHSLRHLHLEMFFSRYCKFGANTKVCTSQPHTHTSFLASLLCVKQRIVTYFFYKHIRCTFTFIWFQNKFIADTNIYFSH